MSRPTTLNFITGNAHKLSEVRAILGTVVTLQSTAIDTPEIQGSIEEIARDKCYRAAEVVRGPVLTEDTALEFNALKALPGPYMYVSYYFVLPTSHSWYRSD
jgi:inosine triphosphate pyrophosphatase